jgi:hypothetical protein
MLTHSLYYVHVLRLVVYHWIFICLFTLGPFVYPNSSSVFVLDSDVHMGSAVFSCISELVCVS